MTTLWIFLSELDNRPSILTQHELREPTATLERRGSSSAMILPDPPASPITPSCGGWAFQYHTRLGYTFEIDNGVDLVMTHGPPKGILDRTLSGARAGSTHVFEAVSRARPRLHCFGHIHEAWADVGEERLVLVVDLSTLRGGLRSEPGGPESLEGSGDKSGKCAKTCYATSHCSGDAYPIAAGSQTLFVNASIKGVDEDYPSHLAWLVDIDLPRAS
ncbi:hypothetical protein RJ035_006331 [Blastomyces gilchristii]